MTARIGAILAAPLGGIAKRDRHVIDQLMEERAPRLSRHPLWPLVRFVALGGLFYRTAIEFADAISPMSGTEVFKYLSAMLELETKIEGAANIPLTGPFILAPSHPTGIADAVAVFDAVWPRRPDLAFFGNRDAIRIAPGLGDMVIPVEWRKMEKSPAKSRATFEATARAFIARRPIVLFPAGRIAYMAGGVLTERPWQSSLISLARRYNYPIVPVHISARNSGLYYWLARLNTDLKDMAVFREFLNKRHATFRLVVGRPIRPAELEGSAIELTARLQHHVTMLLGGDPEAEFRSC